MTLQDLFLVLVVNVIWGLNFIAVDLAVNDLSPFLANSLRFTIVLAVLLPFLRFCRGRMYALLRAAFTLGILHFGMTFLALAFSSEISAIAVAAQLNVPFATVLAVVVLGEKIGVFRLFAIFLAFSGVLVMGFDPGVFSEGIGLIFMIVAAFAYAVAAIMLRGLRDIPVFTVQAWVAFGGVAGSVLMSFAFEEGQWQMIRQASAPAWGGVLFGALASSLIGHGAMTYLLKHHEVTRVAPYLLLTPVFAVIASVMIFDETLSPRVWIGGLLTMTGVAVVTLRNALRSKQD